MIDLYRVELDAPPLPLRVGSTGPGVQRVQEWLGLHGFGVAIDGDFGPATERAVKAFQARRIPVTIDGVVEAATWGTLVSPLGNVATPPRVSFGGGAIAIAQAHLERKAREIGGDNRGPWVRHYCRGHSVAWCQGFASTMWAEAARNTGEPLPFDLMLDGIWCLYVPRMVEEAKAKGRFRDGAGAYRPERGSMFFLRGGSHGYSHVGLVQEAHGDGTMTTIEGNTNDDGSPNGYEVARRTRRVASCDYGSVE